MKLLASDFDGTLLVVEKKLIREILKELKLYVRKVINLLYLQVEHF